VADDEHEGQGGAFAFGPFVFGVPSEEMRRQMEEAHETQHLQVLDFQHTLEEAWQALNYEQLYAVARWMALTADSGNASRNLAYHAGSLFRLAADKSNKCMVCDKDHDKEVESLLNTQGDGATSEVDSEPQPPTDEPAEPNLSYEETQRMIAEHEANVTLYRLTQNFDKGGFNCTGCNMHYASLEDRMLKAPGIEGCSGCQWKSGHG